MNTQRSYLPMSFSLPQMVIVKLDQHHSLTTLSKCIIANIFHMKKHMLTVKHSWCVNNNNFKIISRKKKEEIHQITLNSVVWKKKSLPCIKNGEVALDILQMGVMDNIAKNMTCLYITVVRKMGLEYT